MSRMLPLSGIDAAILVGGMGTRLRGVVDDVPKPLAPVLGRPFLFYQLDLLALRGARSATLCCGFMADLVRRRTGSSWLGMPLHHSIEPEPLGTGGAVALARESLRSDICLVLNGDSWFEPDWAGMRAAVTDGAAIALSTVEDAGRFGRVRLDAEGKITAFEEKCDGAGGGEINAVVYAFKRGVLTGLPRERFSIETGLFPRLAADGRLRGVAHEPGRPFLDIGVPESYAAAGPFFERLGFAPNPMFPDSPPMGEALPKLGTCAVIFDAEGRVAMELRSDCAWWCLPGGRLDAGETLSEGAAREAFEETGLEIEITGFLGAFSDPRRRTVRYPDNGDLRQLVDVVVLAKPIGGSLKKSDESLDVAWFRPEALPLNTVPPVIEILREACAWEGRSVLR